MFAIRDTYVTLRGWAVGVALLVCVGRWAHAHLGADWRWAQVCTVGAAAALTGLWLNEPDRRVRR